MIMSNVIIDPRGTKTRVNRPVIPWECGCGKKDKIVLPQAIGIMIFHCDCGSAYKIDFNSEAGNIYKI
jgi:hypothetical protein